MLYAPLTVAKKMLILQEGLRLKPYRDAVGKLTIGVGRNLEDRGITEEEALHMLGNDLVFYFRALADKFLWFNHLDDVRQLALLSMAFNLGINGVLQFKRMLFALSQRQYMDAAREALDSKWASQVGNRACVLAAMLETGELPDEFK